MAAIGFRNATSIQGNAIGGSAQSLTLPTILPGDDIYLFIGFVDSGSSLTFGGVGSWFFAGSSLISGQNGLLVYTDKSTDGSESGGTATLTFSVTTKFAAICASYSGVRPYAPFALSTPTFGQFTTSNTTSATSPAVNPVPASWTLEAFTSKSTTNTSYTTPSGLTSRQQVFGTGGGAIDLALFDSNGPVTSGGGHTSAMSQATANKIAMTVVLNDQLVDSTIVRQAVNRAAVI